MHFLRAVWFWFWFAIGVYWTGQFAYWLFCIIGWTLSLWAWPTIPGEWMAIALGYAVLGGLARLAEQLTARYPSTREWLA